MRLIQRIVLVVVMATLGGCLGGCTADAYRGDADRQANVLIRDRQNSTLGYNTPIEPAVTTQPSAGKKIYQTLPRTTIADVQTPPITQFTPGLATNIVGPPVPDPNALPTVDIDIVGQTQANFLKKLEYGPPATFGTTMRLGLFDCIAYAVKHSRAYQDRMETVYTSALDVTLQRHLFAPRPFAVVSEKYTGSQRDNSYQAALTATANVGVRQKLPYGGEIVASTLVDFVHGLNDNVSDGESAQIALRGSIPLLRGAGMVNLEALISSERDLVYAIRDFEQYRRGFSVDVASRYFRLLTRHKSVRNRYQNYLNLQDLVNRTQALFDAGKVTALEVGRAQQSLLSGEDLLNSAQQSLDNDLDDFKVFIGMPVHQPDGDRAGRS